MATLFDIEKVKYQCSCTRFKPLCYMYFCKHCVTLKCKECVLHENDTKHYCPSCFDNKTSKEAASLKFKCANCFNCPCCGDTLIIRASNVNPQKKSFYMICGFCRWTTREVNIPDVDKSILKYSIKFFSKAFLNIGLLFKSARWMENET